MIRSAFYIDIRAVAVFILMALSVVMEGQNIMNPFEIRGRLEDVDTTTFSHNSIDTANRNDNNYKTITTQMPSFDSNSFIPDPIEIKAGNAFEVNHIPLLRRDVRQSKNHTSTNITNKSTSCDNTESSRDFIFWFIILSLILLSLALSMSRKIFGIITKSMFNENILRQEFRGHKSRSLNYIILYLVFIINISIFILLLGNYFDYCSITIANMLLIMAIVLGVYTIRHSAMAFLGYVFPIQKDILLYSFAIQVFNSFVGFMLIPMNLIIAFGSTNFIQTLIYFTLILIGILLIIRTLRGLAISYNYIVDNLFLFFVYLCALEIAPLLIIIRVFSLKTG